jgi:hypothetical protein
MSTPESLASVLAEVSDWGPFFAAATHPRATAPVPPWRPMRELLDDPDVLSGRVAAVRSRLAAGRPVDRIPVRVAASVTQLGLAARLLSPALGCMVRSGSSPIVDLADLWWQPTPGSLFPLSVGHRPGEPADLITGPVRELVLAMRAFSVPERVLWGNVASALNGAATMIGTARPDLTPRAIAMTVALLDLPPLRHTSIRRPDGRFQRRSCCLIYRAAPADPRGARCGDCVLATG